MAPDTAEDDSFAGGGANSTAGGGGGGEGGSTSLMNPNDAGAIPLNLPLMKLELTKKAAECQQRGLAHSYKWLAEISYALRFDKKNHSR